MNRLTCFLAYIALLLNRQNFNDVYDISNRTVYTFKQGENCNHNSLTQTRSLEVKHLEIMNPDLNCKSVYPGQNITVPEYKCDQYYRVKKGDCCSGIALNYRMTYKNLLKINPNLNCESLPQIDLCVRTRPVY